VHNQWLVDMEDITVIEYEDIDLSNAMVIIAFPTVGLISSIAGHFIIDSLKLKEVGSIVSRYLSPTAVIHKSRPSPPVRIYSGKKMCGPLDSCDRLAVIISEFMPPMEIIKPLADTIFDWVIKKDGRIIAGLEGTHAVGEVKEENLEVYGIGTTPDMSTFLKKHKIKETQDGMITGITGVLLYEGVLRKRDVLCLLAEAHAAYPDARAAGNLLEKLDVMLPGIKLDPEPLYKEAESIEKKIKQFMEQSKPTAPTLPPTPTTMYG
jgi:uncharacterized protein